jgi:polyhydroxyalkanoate synthase
VDGQPGVLRRPPGAPGRVPSGGRCPGGRGRDPVDDAKAALAAGFLLDAAAPTNFLATNPAALKRALETAGVSVAAGAGHFADDLLNNGGRPRLVDTRPFTIGENLASTRARWCSGTSSWS